jgi:Ubiquitin carboxyl-terminal hydrolase
MNTHVPLSIQFTGMTKSINEIARVECKTGFV